MASNMATCTMAMVRVATNGCCLAVMAQFNARSFHSVIESAPAQAGRASISPATSHQGLAMANDNNLNFRNFTNPPLKASRFLVPRRVYLSSAAKVLAETSYFPDGFLVLRRGDVLVIPCPDSRPFVLIRD